jgi:hypothetical protein
VHLEITNFFWMPPISTINVKNKQAVEKLNFFRLIKNARMQGARNSGECGVLECTLQRLSLLDNTLVGFRLYQVP